MLTKTITCPPLIVPHSIAATGKTRRSPNDALGSITWPAKGKLRIRKVVRRSNYRMTTKYPSWKTGRMIECESTLERAACVLHDADSQVLSYTEQPAKLRFMMDGIWHEHTPDLLALTPSGPIFREVKPASAAKDSFVTERTSLLERALPSHGYRYELLLENEIIRQPRLRNAEFVLRYGRFPLDVIQLERVRRILGKRPITWGDARNGALGDKGIQALCSLILTGDIPVAYNLSWISDMPVMAGVDYD